jgi:CheY-like chemotaxis protein
LKQSPEVPQCIHSVESKLRQVLVNLLGNAIKFTQTGQVTLCVTTDPTPPHSTANSKSTPLSLRFSVEDTGCGIAPNNFSRLFEPFVQTEAGYQAQEGTGLGLPISQRFVRLMGGDLIVESTLGQGSTFSFTIQTCAVVLEDVPKPAPSRQVIGLEAGQRPYRILIAEDKRDNRRMLVELLTAVGFEVREAVNGQGAIDFWRNWSPDLIWMDIRMPVMNGFEATQQIKAAGGPPIIALTGSAFEEDRLTALAIGFDDFVRKPIRLSVIFEKMAEHLGVRYIYADEPEGNAGRTKPVLTVLTAENLAVMSIDWINQLHQASLGANAKQARKLIQQIPSEHQDLADALTDLVDRFDFEELIELTQKAAIANLI